jgi:hypothetical protein
MPLTQQALENIRLGEGGSYSLARDAISHRLWDVRTFGAVASDFTFFSQPVGSTFLAGSLKTLTETNLYDTGKLPNGQTFLATRMCIASQITGGNNVALSMAQDFQNIIQNSVFEIRLAGREYDFQVPGRMFMPTPISAFGITTSTNGRVGDMISSGWAKLAPTPIFIDQLVSFSVIQRLQTATPALQTILNTSCSNLSNYYAQLMVILDGFLTRAK